MRLALCFLRALGALRGECLILTAEQVCFFHRVGPHWLDRAVLPAAMVTSIAAIAWLHREVPAGWVLATCSDRVARTGPLPRVEPLTPAPIPTRHGERTSLSIHTLSLLGKHSMNRTRTVIVLGAWSWLVSVFAAADDWPQWRGPARDGVWNETGIVERFESDRIALEMAYGDFQRLQRPTVADGRVYVSDRVITPREIERVHCFAAETGNSSGRLQL